LRGRLQTAACLPDALAPTEVSTAQAKQEGAGLLAAHHSPAAAPIRPPGVEGRLLVIKDDTSRVTGDCHARIRRSRRLQRPRPPGSLVRLIREWLKAGVIENGAWSETREGTAQGASVSPLLANVYLDYVFDLWADRWRRQARGDLIIVRFADDDIVGFQHQDEAERFLAEFRDRLAQFGLEPAAEKTRLIELGRFAAERRQKRGLGKPETFAFLGFTHICGETSNGRFQLQRITEAKRLRAKLREVKTELMRRRHLPIPEQGQWRASVVRGHLAYYAVPGNGKAVNAFRFQAIRHWHRALRRRSQRSSLNWKRISRLAQRSLPPVPIIHPWPDARFHARIQARSPVS